jgi:hypothetical protein
MTGFDKLRLAAKKTVATTVLATALLTGAAHATPYDLNKDNLIVHAANASWYVSNDTSASSTNGFGIEYAFFGSKNSDFANYESFCLSVNETRYVVPSGSVDISSTSSGVTVKGGESKTKDGLAFRSVYFFSKKSPVTRAVHYVRNTKNSPVVAHIRTASFTQYNVILTSSDGNKTFNNLADRSLTYVYDSDVSGDSFYYLPFTQYRFGTGSVKKPDDLKPAFNSPNLVDTYTVTIPAGKTVIVMEFISLYKTHSISKAVSLSKDPKFNSLGTLLNAGYLADLSPTDWFSIINWKF